MPRCIVVATCMYTSVDDVFCRLRARLLSEHYKTFRARELDACPQWRRSAKESGLTHRTFTASLLREAHAEPACVPGGGRVCVSEEDARKSSVERSRGPLGKGMTRRRVGGGAERSQSGV
jgi:hypothetical protein